MKNEERKDESGARWERGRMRFSKNAAIGHPFKKIYTARPIAMFFAF